MADTKQNSTAPPPFDPEAYAKSSESALQAASDSRLTATMKTPPLNKRVRVAVPAEDLDWFELSEGARALLARVDGSTTLFDLLEGGEVPDMLKAIAELHDAHVLAYED
ncbi:MAG: hypothetical protein ACRELB_12370 [Polyangiaceae bacterium]